MLKAHHEVKRFWWVNHSQTWRAEVEGGFIWSPQEEANGARSQFYDNLLRALPGDAILSFADTRIRAIGKVLDYAAALHIPLELRSSSPRWRDEGWLVPISWNLVNGPRTKDIIESIRRLLPQKYSPLLHKDGRGSQKAYLCEISEALFEEVVSHCDTTTTQFQIDPPALLIEEFKEMEEEEIVRNLSRESIEATESLYLLKARNGQGIFRQRVLSRERECRITGISDSSLLIASHIKPWRSCVTSTERLDGENGLLLSPNADLLFDRGLLTFERSGTPVLSPHLNRGAASALLPANCPPRPFSSAQQDYMDYHRNRIFLR